MQDLFLEYEVTLEDFLRKKYWYEEMRDNFNGLIVYLRDSMIEIQPGNDVTCLDYMDYAEYCKMVSKNFSGIVREKTQEYKKLERDYKNAYYSLIEITGSLTELSQVSFLDLTQILVGFDIPFKIMNANDQTVIVLGGIDAFYVAKEKFDLISFDDCHLVINAPHILFDFIEYLVCFRAQFGEDISMLEIIKSYKNEKKELV